MKGLRSYERTSSAQENAAGECMCLGTTFGRSESSALEKIQLPSGFPEACDVKLPTSDMPETCDVKHSTCDVPEPSGVPEDLKKVMQQFSGLQNCTFNFLPPKLKTIVRYPGLFVLLYT